MGKVIVISAPSGCGKTTIIKELLKRLPDLVYSVSLTSRERREGEMDGKDYFFISKKEFRQKIKNNEFLEWTKVYNNYYGTSKKFIEENIKNGKNCILDLDVRGGLALKKIFPQGLYIYIVPKSEKDLEYRLRNRKTDTENEIKLRIKNAKKEMTKKKYYDYVIINAELDQTVNEILAIIKNKLYASST